MAFQDLGWQPVDNGYRKLTVPDQDEINEAGVQALTGCNPATDLVSMEPLKAGDEIYNLPPGSECVTAEVVEQLRAAGLSWPTSGKEWARVG